MVYASDPRPKYAIGQPVKFTITRTLEGIAPVVTVECTATGIIDGYQPFEGKIHYTIEVRYPIDKNSEDAIEWIHENEGSMIQLLEDQFEPFPSLPKFQPGEKVTFMITLPVTAEIDAVEWDESAEGFYYSVKETSVYTEELDEELNPNIHLEYLGDVVIDEAYTSVPEDKLLKKIEIPPQDLVSADYRPSCEFDDN